MPPSFPAFPSIKLHILLSLSSSPSPLATMKPSTTTINHLLFAFTIPSSLLLLFFLLSSSSSLSYSTKQSHLHFPPTPTTLPPIPTNHISPTPHLLKPLTIIPPHPPPHSTEPILNHTHHSPTSQAAPPPCDVSDGQWVFDDSYPLYTSTSCPFIDEGFSCEANGRPDKDYMKWRWQPRRCDIPRFDPVRLLEMIRGKRLVFVGDSINRNQWESMLCLLSSAVPDRGRIRGRKITKERGNYNFKFLDYGCSVEYYVSHFLVQEGKARVGQRRTKTLKIDRIDRRSSRWRGADILVFNTAHWWSHYKTKAGVNYYQEGDQVHPQLDVSIAFKKALMTWALWVDQHATPGKTQVFFRSSSPTHFREGEWNSGGHCMESSQPLNDTSGRPKPEKTVIVEQVVKQMRTPVTILNITHMSGLRIDGHPSVYGKKPGRGAPSSIQDCSHWCLPGLPDIWNELLYFNLLSLHRTVLTN